MSDDDSNHLYPDTLAVMVELITAGLPVVGFASTGRIDWAQPPTPEQTKRAQKVIEKHNLMKRKDWNSEIGS